LYGKNWWQVAIISEAVDTYVVERDSRIVAFAVLVKNEDMWRKERKKLRKLLVFRFLSCIVCPMLAAATIRRKLKGLLSGTKKYLLKHSVKRSYHRTWLELLAVLPEERGQGIAKRLLQECESVTKDMGRDAIGLMVPTTNLSAIRLYDKIGYNKIGKSSENEIYLKVLNSTLA
jgi:ribosomal protein S18 acetylase RimI-like enzyme